MQEEQKIKILKSLKLRPGISNFNDELLKDLISDYFNDVAESINLSEGLQMPVGCINIVKELVVVKINRLGSEGISSESHEGISQTYTDDIPNEIKTKLRRYRRLP
ncbi:hypothetical protein BTM21_03805 [Clostridium chauvoei]|nr:hypothetical protein BTM20_09235 [Clostridium chauvoei]ATD58668.1 hypothetical protein BTM21_03805 [Clostridium chauvoei]